MEQKRNSLYPPPFNEQGFVLAFVLMLLIVILGLTMASASITLYHMKSSNAFYRIIKDQLFAPQAGTKPSSTNKLLVAPEGWDQICFSTRLTERSTSTMQLYSWRVALRDQCPDIPQGITRIAQRPHIIIIIDDSITTAASSGQEYSDDALYAKWITGGITHISDICEIEDTYTDAEGIYFKGMWGNSYQRAPAQGSLTGAMSVWTKALSYARSLFESLDLCEVSLMSTSQGVIRPFTLDWQKILECLDGVHPASASAPLSEALFNATTLFPSQCVSGKHIILVTAGVPINDGHLPPWLKDFDHDGNPKDTAFEGEGSHCLDDVSSYAKSLGIHVHIIGPDTQYLRSVAIKGGGQYMPVRGILAPEQMLVTQPIVVRNDQELILKNLRARLDPPWLKTDQCRFFRPSIVSPLSLVSCPDLSLNGLAHDLAAKDTDLYCTTTRDQLLKVTMPEGSLTWLMTGIGGEVCLRGERIITGPNRLGIISCIGRGPQVIWQHKGTCIDASDSMVYISNGPTIHAYNLETGTALAQFEVNHTINVVRYDPCTDGVFAGTSDGLVYLFNNRLELYGIINTTTNNAIMEIRPFNWRKGLHLIVASNKRLECYTSSRNEWSISLEGGSPSGMTIMNNKLFLSTWSEDSPCGGIDTGISMLQEYDALTGRQTRTEAMFMGRAFGPTIDLDNGVMKFISSTGTVYNNDISQIPGISPLTLGRRLITHSE
jgi:hypothetical protein